MEKMVKNVGSLSNLGNMDQVSVFELTFEDEAKSSSSHEEPAKKHQPRDDGANGRHGQYHEDGSVDEIKRRARWNARHGLDDVNGSENDGRRWWWRGYATDDVANDGRHGWWWRRRRRPRNARHGLNDVDDAGYGRRWRCPGSRRRHARDEDAAWYA